MAAPSLRWPRQLRQSGCVPHAMGTESSSPGSAQVYLYQLPESVSFFFVLFARCKSLFGQTFFNIVLVQIYNLSFHSLSASLFFFF